jgi:hypothetical protein
MELRKTSSPPTCRSLGPAIAVCLLVAGTAVADGGADPATHCPLRFDQQTTGLQRTCLFVGRFTDSDRAMLAAFAGDGTAVVVAIARENARPLLYLPAEVDSPTSGRLFRVQSATVIDTGTVTLEDGGRRLRLRASRTAGQSGPPAEFVGRFAAMVGAADAEMAAPAETVLSQR